MTEQNNTPAVSDIAVQRNARVIEKAEEAAKRIAGLRDLRGNIGLSFDDVKVPKLNEKGDFYWNRRELAIDGKVLTALVDRRVADGSMQATDVVKWDGGEAVRNEKGAFDSFTVPTKAKMDNSLIQAAAFKTLMLDTGRQFLADPKNIDLLKNQTRSPDKDGGAKSQPVRGVAALVQAQNGRKDYITFVSKEDILARMKEQPRVAPYIAKAVLEGNTRYVDRNREMAKAADQAKSQDSRGR